MCPAFELSWTVALPCVQLDAKMGRKLGHAPRGGGGLHPHGDWVEFCRLHILLKLRNLREVPRTFAQISINFVAIPMICSTVLVPDVLCSCMAHFVKIIVNRIRPLWRLATSRIASKSVIVALASGCRWTKLIFTLGARITPIVIERFSALGQEIRPTILIRLTNEGRTRIARFHSHHSVEDAIHWSRHRWLEKMVEQPFVTLLFATTGYWTVK